MQHPSIKDFWWFVQEREAIRLRKEDGYIPPWTTDSTLHKYHFCNIRRADDYGTRWYVKHIASNIPNRPFESLLWLTMLYRLVNNIEWFDAVGGLWSWGQWNYFPNERNKIITRILAGPKPHSPAYIILQAPGNTDGRAGQLIKILDRLSARFPSFSQDILQAESLEGAWKKLKEPYGMGPFIALQVMRDLLLADALPFNENDFTYLGPGARGGLQALGVPDNYQQMYDSTVALMNDQPNSIDPPLVLGDVEHCLCEYFKYVKFREGKGRRRRYKPHVQNLAVHE